MNERRHPITALDEVFFRQDIFCSWTDPLLVPLLVPILVEVRLEQQGLWISI